MSLSVIADVPDQITYQGRLLYNGSPVTSATSIVFRLYQTSSGGSAVWTETHGSVTPDSTGIYTVVLGSTVAIPDDYDALWIELVVAGNVLTPRKKLTSSPFVLRVGELPNLYVSGNVGIGTSSPLGTLHVVTSGTPFTPDTASDDLVVGSSDHTGISLQSGAASSGRLVFAQSGDTEEGGIVYDHNADKMRFDTNSTANQMVIDSSGNVGIGTTSPYAPLHVMASDASVGGPDASTVLQIEKNGSAAITIRSPATAAGTLFFGDSVSATVGRVQYDHNTNKLALWTSDNQRLTIDNSGNVGIGTTGPEEKLSVHGNIMFGVLGSVSREMKLRVSIAEHGQSCDSNCGAGFCLGGYREGTGAKDVCSETVGSRACICIGK